LVLKLKVTKNEERAVELVRKQDFKLEHLPLKLRQSAKVWLALTEKMSFQEFCELIHIYARNDIIPVDSPAERLLLDTLISAENDQLKL
jgi:hypothetical protein